ncbi:MAG: integrase arm-type DNA-binding domain-containing protein [Lysobacterales bacterium]
MPKVAKALGAAQVARITKPGFHAVGGCPGLQLQVTEGGRSWVLRAMVGSRRREIGLGSCGEVSLADAREQCRQMRAQIRAGIDPVAERAAARAALLNAQTKEITFAEAARRAHQARAAEFRNAKHRAGWISSLESYAFPIIGNLPVNIITVAHVLQVLEPIWTTKTETATRVRQRIETVLSWATVSRFREGDNPARWADNLKELLPLPAKVRKRRHHPALPWQEVPGFMVKLREREGVSALALQFAILTAGRSGEVRNATWNEVDLAAGIWTIPAERMKAGRKHEVPLSPAAVAILQALPRTSDYVFAAPRGGPLSDMSISAVCRRMEVEAVPHGFRSSFKDWARNETRFADEVSELALAHVNNDATRSAYARDGLLPQRAQLLNRWADYCAKPRPAVATVTPIKNARKASGESR